MKILIADDHALVRDTISAFLESQGDLTVRVAEDFATATCLIASEGPFDLILLDYHMDGMKGIDSIREAMARNGGKPVAVLSGSAPADVAQRVLDCGAAGFLPKTMPAKSLVNAIRFMAAGETYVPFTFLAQREARAPDPTLARMTPREIDVLRGLIDGRSNKEIARGLELQEVTVKLHVKTLCRKLEARNRTHAAMLGKDAVVAIAG